MFVGRILLILVILFLFYRMVRFLFRLPGGTAKPSIPRAGGTPAKSEDMVKDPCCGVYIPVSEAKCLVVNGERRYFCSDACMDAFRKSRNP